MAVTRTPEFRKFEKKLKNNKYHLVRMNGSHFIFHNEKRNDTISINKDPNRMVCQRLAKEHNLT